MRNKFLKSAILLFGLVVFLAGCSKNPLTGKSTMAFVSNDELFPSAFQEYDEFLSEHTVITGTDDARMVAKVGDNIKNAVEKWFAFDNNSDFLKDYEWEYNLVKSDEVNAWCMPGGKIVVYTGILPVTQNEDALAVVLGHEVAHALLNHAQQRMSADVLKQLGAIGLSLILGDEVSETTQDLAMLAYGVGSELLGTMPFSRAHENEADHYGLILMAIAGYNPEESTAFWERMDALQSSWPEFLSTHPSSSNRISSLRESIPEAKDKAVEINRAR